LEWGESIACGAAREAEEETGLRVTVDAAAGEDVPGYAGTDAIYRGAPSTHGNAAHVAGRPPVEEPVTYHYGIVHVLAFLDIPLNSSPLIPLPLPVVTARDDARDATWFAFTDAQLLDVDGDIAAGDATRPRTSVAALQRDGTLVPQIDRVAARCLDHVRARAAATGATLMSDVAAARRVSWRDVAWGMVDLPFGAAMGVGFALGAAAGAWVS
jgi:8-oxo-dGTP pyrophosphatase MutT (NUDIX family)